MDHREGHHTQDSIVFKRFLEIHTDIRLLLIVLHDQLLAAQQHLSAHQHQAPPRTHPSAPQPHTASPRDQHNIDPAIAGPSLLSRPPELQARPESPSDDGVKTYGKRPLSTSKRAAQNRAAQVYTASIVCQFQPYR